jgi:hypothetical protein
MEIPAELRRTPLGATLEWVAGLIGPDARVTGVRRLRNAWSAAMHAVDVVGIERPETWRGHDAGRTDITIDALVRSLDDFLVAALDRLS